METGQVWGFSFQGCHVESLLVVSPGTVVSLSIQWPGAPGIRFEQGIVT